MKTILTIDQAFNDANFLQLKAELDRFHAAGVRDMAFLETAEPSILSRDSSANWVELAQEQMNLPHAR